MTRRINESTGKRTLLMTGIFAAVIMMIALMFGGIKVDAARRKISKTKAKTIAAKHAGFKKSKVKFTKAKYDKGDNEYDIEFVKGNYKYEYEISAKTGRVKDHEKERIHKAKKSKGKYIGAAKAKQIALKKAGLKASKVKFTKVKMDTEDGVKVYEIEFRKGRREYEYTIHAKTGKVLEAEIDSVND